MSVKILLCAMLALSLVVSYSQAEIDPDKIVGIWLLDEGKGDTAEDASENGRKAQLPTANGWTGRSMVPLKSRRVEPLPFRLGKV